jgi:hypothetical protein
MLVAADLDGGQCMTVWWVSGDDIYVQPYAPHRAHDLNLQPRKAARLYRARSDFF